MAACHCRGSKEAYVKYAAILNSLLSVSHAEQGVEHTAKFVVHFMQRVSITRKVLRKVLLKSVFAVNVL